MITVFSEYAAIKNGIAALIETSGYRNDYIAKRIGMKPANFSLKKQRKSWTDIELKKIIDIIIYPNAEVEDLLMLQIARARKNDETLSYEEYKKEIASWK